MNTKILYLACLLLCGHVVAAEAVPAPMAARYELKINKTKSDWYLWREADRIETLDMASGQHRLWERTLTNEGEDYSYQWIFDREQRVIEYSPGEIRTREAQPDWASLSSIIAPSSVFALKRGAGKTLFGQPAVYYSGIREGKRISLWWLTQAQLPAQLSLRSTSGSIEMTLKEMHPQSPSAWPRVDADKVAGYEKIDAADFGDKENDPFVARIMQMEGHSHAH